MNAQPPAYDASYYATLYGGAELRPYSARWWPVRWYASMTRRCLQAGGGRRLLDIGCGPGHLLAWLERDYDTVGVDVSEFAIEASRRIAPHARCVVGDLEGNLPEAVNAGGFDVIVAKYVFEHLRDPLAALKRVHGLLSPGGTLLLVVPNTESLGARRKGAAWYARLDPTHCSLLAPATWRAHIGATGLELIRESADGWWDVPYLPLLPTTLQLPLFAGPSALACLSGRPLLPAMWGENHLFFARRPA